MILSKAKFAQAVNLSRPGVGKAVKDSNLIVNENGKIDTDHGVNKAWIYSDTKKKSAYFRYKKKFEDDTNTVKPKKTAAKTVKKAPEIDELSSDKVKKPPLELPKSGDESHISMGDIAEKKMVVSYKIEQEKYIKASFANQLLVNKVADRDILQFCTERFINLFITSIKRVSSTSLTDISKDVLANGKVENRHFSAFEDACLEMVHDAKMQLVKDMRNGGI